MSGICGLNVFTANVLGVFNDPFEFDGDYGEKVNSIREYVFEQVVSKEALARNLPNVQITQIKDATVKDINHGPTLIELLPLELVVQLQKKQNELQADGFSKTDLEKIFRFIERFGDQKIFYFFRYTPSNLLSLSKILIDRAKVGKFHFDLPILGSAKGLTGGSSWELKANLMDALFTKKIFGFLKSNEKLKNEIEQLDPNELMQHLGPKAVSNDLNAFISPAGQVFVYWLYQSLNLHLISQNEKMIPQINEAKKIFAETLGSSFIRGSMFRDRLVKFNAGLVFTQESDAVFSNVLTTNELFHSVEIQNPADGTFVFLRKDIWKSDYQVISVDDYEGFQQGRLNVILATKTDTDERFLLASAHGNSTRAEDGRLQISKIVEKFHQLCKLPENKNLQLVIGIDANTKTEQDVKLLMQLFESLGLVSTNVGPTTVKRRMVSEQHEKVGRFAVDEEDYVIVLNPEKGGFYRMARETVGFKKERPDPGVVLPNIENQSDHYVVGTTLLRKEGLG